MPREGRVVIGAVRGPHGVKGGVRLESFLVGNIDLREIAEVFIAPSGLPAQKMSVKSVRPAAKGWILELEGIGTPEQVAELKGATVAVDSRLLPPAGEGEYYWKDLIGLTVFTASGERVGLVKGLVSTGAQDLLEVDAPGKEILIPVVEPIVKEVDIEAGRIIVDPPEGLLD